MSAYKAIPFAGFGGGLNLKDSIDLVNEAQALDALNVIFTTRGTVEQRSGYAKFSASEGSNRYDSLTNFYKSDGTKQIVGGAGNRLDALNASGTVIANTTSPTASPHYFQRFGGPTAEHLYIANGIDTVRRWDGSAFSTPTYTTHTPTGRFLGLMSTDNRLVVARYTGSAAGSNPSTVRFSNEGDPLAFATTSYVDLTPGDGEEIMGVASWRDILIVFKQTKFFVFFGNSVDDDGLPEFNYRPVETGVGLASSRALAVSEQGVYFLDRNGVYFTTGGQPTRVSDLVEPIFRGAPSVYYLGGILNDGSITQSTMQYHDERLWLSFPADTATTNNRNLIFDPHQQWWSLADIPAGPMTIFRVSNVDELIFGYASGLKHLGRFATGAYTADDMATDGTGGTAISSRWRSGWFNLGNLAVKTIRELKIGGYGAVTIAMARDYKQTPSWSKRQELSPPGTLYNSGALYDSDKLYGPSTQITEKLVRRAIRGEVFSLMLSNNTINRSFKVNKMTNHVREVRMPSVVKVT